jgi:recombinational DNA repair ATPase RecF
MTIQERLLRRHEEEAVAMSAESVAQLVRTRLAASDLTEGARRFVLAAVAGEPALKHALTSPDEPTGTAVADQSAMLRNVWLRSITVRGFRGIGRASKLEVEPGPGLTLVVGRNGSGKSSFAEGIEIALTGQNERLLGKTADWQKQWRNIHDGENAEVTVEFQVEGEGRGLIVQRSWTGRNLDDAESAAAWDDGEQYNLAELGWNIALEQYRPFLSYDDLGKVSDRPSVGFDLLVGVLGLEAITGAQDLLTAARTDVSKTLTEPRDALPALLKVLSTIEDERARRVTRALTSDPADIAEVRRVLAEVPEASGRDSRLSVLTRLVSLPGLDAEMVAKASAELYAAAAAVEAVKGTDAEEAQRLADLLDAVLAHHASHGDGPCPVCGQGTLDANWKQHATDEIGQLRERARDAINARDRLQAAVTRARELIHPAPLALSGPGPADIDTSLATSAWRDWSALGRETDALALAADLERLAPVLGEAIRAVRDQAAKLLRSIEDAWRPAATQVQGWLNLWGCAETARTSHLDISAALAWIKDQAEQLRQERLAPFSAHSARIWADLRQESNVDLGPIAFTGSGRTRRKLDVPVRIDGAHGGVPMLSNGELHALGLALFLPRSTAPDSPFRFVLIDDPVQAMDPSKVEGLAQVLHETAATRQVIVLTHDDRLADALRRLMLPTTILEVTRREGSLVEIVPDQDPVHRCLQDARQLARTPSLPDDLAVISATGCCRDAVEIACQRVARRKLRTAGGSITEIDERLSNARTTMHRVALALLGDEHRSAQVMPTLNRLAGAPWAADVLRAVREGTHQPRGDLDRIIGDSGRLCDLILATP